MKRVSEREGKGDTLLNKFNFASKKRKKEKQQQQRKNTKQNLVSPTDKKIYFLQLLKSRNEKPFL